MLRFKQFLIEKNEDDLKNYWKWVNTGMWTSGPRTPTPEEMAPWKSEMNTPSDLADFPEDEPISLNAFTPSFTSPLAPLKYTRSGRDAYYEALQKRNEQILQNNKKYKLSQPTIDTSFEDAVLKTRKEVEKMVMDPNNKRDPNFEEKQKLNPMGAHTMTDMAPPELGGTSWVDALRPDNPVNLIKVYNSANNWLKNTAKDALHGFDYITDPIYDPIVRPLHNLLSTHKFSPRVDSRAYDPLWDAHHEAGLKQERNRRLGVSPSVANPLETVNYFDSPDYFDRIEAVAQHVYNANYSGFVDKLSPFDILSLQFGKDKAKERNEFLEKQKEYLIRSGRDQSSESNQAKLARAYADLRDPSYDEKVLYEPIDINVVTGGETLGWAGQTTSENPVMWRATLGAIIDAENKKQKETGMTPSSLSVQQNIQRAIDDEMRINPKLLKPKIDLNKSNIKDWEEFISVLSHEAEHALATPEAAKSRLENIINNSNNQELQYKSPATIKYGLEPSIGGMTLGSGYEELEKRKLADSFKNYSKNQIKSNLEKDDIPGPGIIPGIPSSYYWSRTEIPAFMKQLKLNLLNKTGKYPTSDETDEEIEQDRDKLYDMSPKDIEDPLSYLKALELMKTPEGKAIWRGVKKSAPEKDRRYA